MKYRLLLLVAILLLAWAVGAAVSRPLGTYAPVAGENRLPGVALAQGITQLTGVAVSPLLGVSAVGAWRFHETPAAQRHLLPWFCRPYVWGVTFALLAVCLLKDLLGTAAPPFIKKPLDLLELFENKLSALVACSAFLPFIVSELTEEQRLSGGASLSAAAHLQFASVLPLPAGMDARLLTIPMAVIGFMMVWLACHAINVLIVLCPFGFIDAVLKLFKASVLMALVSASFIHPYLGAAVSLVIVFVAGLVAPWACSPQRLRGFLWPGHHLCAPGSPPRRSESIPCLSGSQTRRRAGPHLWPAGSRRERTPDLRLPALARASTARARHSDGKFCHQQRPPLSVAPAGGQQRPAPGDPGRLSS